MHFKDAFSKRCIFSVIGIVLIAFGTAFAIFWIDIFHTMMAKEIQLGPNTKTYDVWKTPPFPVSLDIYLYNWTNPQDFRDKPFAKPILQEIGPYRFTEKLDKTNINWNTNNATVSYFKLSTFYFDAEASVGDLNDSITTINVIALTAAAKASKWSYISQKQVSIGLNLYDQEVFITKTASELLFEGYQDDIIDMAIELKSFGGEEFVVPADRFGWFYTRNNSAESTGYFNVHTGDGDISQIGSVKNWNYKGNIDYYKDECSVVNGSAGEFYPPKQTKEKPVTIFTPDLCRSITFDFEQEIDVMGIKGYKYAAGAKTIDNGTIYSENKCYSVVNKTTPPSGVFDTSDCRYGAPVYVSYPHYYAADPYYLQFYECDKKSEKEKHEFYIVLEPMTGIVLEVAARLQINLQIKPVPNIALYEDAPFMYFPALWFEQKITVNNEMASDIKMVISIPFIGYICIGVIIIIGFIILSWIPILRLIRKKLKLNKKDSKLKTHDDHNYCGGGGNNNNNSDNNNGTIKKSTIPPENSPLIDNKNYKVEFINSKKIEETIKLPPSDADKIGWNVKSAP